MTRFFHLPVDAARFFRIGLALAVGAAVSQPICAAQSASTPPVAMPYTITTAAGSGSPGSTGNGGPATSATISSDLRDVAVDGQGNIFFADTGNNEIREVNAQTGIISLVAGGNTPCAAAIDKTGDGCPAATATTLNNPRGVAVDKAGNLYIAGYSDELIHEVNAQTGIMTMVAGDLSGTGSTCTNAATCAQGTKGYSGDGGPATSAELDQPRGVAVDNFGNLWIADTSNNVVREVNAKTGIITTAVGNDANLNGSGTGESGYGGDGGPANSTSALMNEPVGIVFDSQNNAYITDFNNKVIREVNASTGILSTLIGGENNTAASATSTTPSWPASASTTALGCPTKIAIDRYANLYFADSCESVIDFYDATAQTIIPIAGEYGYGGTMGGSYAVCGTGTGTGTATDTVGDGCDALNALFYEGNSAVGVALGGQNYLYITDPGDERIRKVSTNMTFPVQAVATPSTQTIELHFAKGDSETSLTAGGASKSDFTIASAPTCTTNSDATVNCTAQIAFSPLYPGLRTSPLTVVGALSHRSFPLAGVGKGALTSVDPGTVSTLGSGLSGSLGEATDAVGNLYIADTGNNRVVEIGAAGTQTVIAGTGTAGYSGDSGLATAAELNAPKAVTIAPSGLIYIADTGNNLIRVIDPVTGDISTFAGGATGVCATANDTEGDFCPATSATLSAPSGVAVNTLGDLLIADSGDNLIRRVDSGTGYINLEAGGASALCTGSSDTFGDGCPAVEAKLKAPAGLAVDAANNIYVADSGDNEVRAISPGTGAITAVAGNGQASFSGDNGAATSASLNAPQAVALDAADDVYIADTANDAVRVVNSASGTISRLFGVGGSSGLAGGSGPASQVELASPGGIAVNMLGNVYVNDSGNSRALADDRNSADLAFGYSNIGNQTPEQIATVSDLGNTTLAFTDSPVYSPSSTTGFAFDTSAANACEEASILDAGSNCTLGISFFPPTGSAPGTVYSGDLELPSNAVNASSATINLSGTGEDLAATTLSLALTSPSSGNLEYGEAGIVTASLNIGDSTLGAPTGTITFTIDGAQQPAVTLSSTGTATVTINLAVGTHTIVAAYSGDVNYAASNNTLSIPVATASTTTVLTASPTTSIQLQPIVFSATVTSGTTGIPSGTVNFYSGSTLLGSGNLSPAGMATFTDSSLAIASYSVTAEYMGTSNYSTSTSAPLAVTVNPIPPGFSATVNPAAISVPQGGDVQTVLTVTPQGGITGSITLSCTGLPANAKCTFYPTAIPLNGSNTLVTTALTIYTGVTPLTLESRLQAPGKGSSPRPLMAAALFPALFLGFAGWMGFRRRSWSRLLTLLLTVGTLSMLVCMQGCTSNPTQEAATITPTGTSTVNVVMTGPDSTSQTIPITLTVIANTAAN